MADDDFNDDDMLENAIQATEEIIYGAEINRRTPCRHTLHRVQLKRFMKKIQFLANAFILLYNIFLFN